MCLKHLSLNTMFSQKFVPELVVQLIPTCIYCNTLQQFLLILYLKHYLSLVVHEFAFMSIVIRIIVSILTGFQTIKFVSVSAIRQMTVHVLCICVCECYSANDSTRTMYGGVCVFVSAWLYGHCVPSPSSSSVSVHVKPCCASNV